MLQMGRSTGKVIFDFLHIPAVISGDFSVIGMLAHGDDEIDMSFALSADHGKAAVFHVAAALPHHPHILPYDEGHHLVFRYHMKFCHPPKAIIKVKGGFRFLSAPCGGKGGREEHGMVLIFRRERSVSAFCFRLQPEAEGAQEADFPEYGIS